MSTRRIVVVGGGASGLGLAARLAAAGHAVTIVEMGAASDPATDAASGRADGPHRARDLSGAMPGTATTVAYRTDLRPDGGYLVARGSTLGGSSAVNGAYFLRAHPADFAGWARAAGDEWSYANCLPALRGLESDRDFPDGRVHGADGPVPVERPADDAITRRFLGAAVAASATGLETDKNAGGPSGAGLLACNVRAGVRWGADRAYGPMLRAAGVEVVRGRVERIRFDGERATGVELAGPDGARTIPADEVVVCAGAIETPLLLRRSGIGARDEVGAPLVAELPAVGHGLSDHAAIDLRWTPRAGAVDAAAEVAWGAAWNIPAGERAALPLELLAAVVPTASVLTGAPIVDGPIDLRVGLSGTAAPRGRGDVRATAAGVAIRYDYLRDPDERAALREGVRAGVAVLRSTEMAAVVDGVELVATLGADASDAALDAWIADRLATSLHSSGTARMGAGPGDAVVDAHGRVFGVTGLRVADTSILPLVPTRGTSNTAFLIGERIAQLLLAEDAPAPTPPPPLAPA